MRERKEHKGVTEQTLSKMEIVLIASTALPKRLESGTWTLPTWRETNTQSRGDPRKKLAYSVGKGEGTMLRSQDTWL